MKTIPRQVLSMALGLLAATPAAFAADKYWDAVPATSAWGTASNWNTDGITDANNPAAAPGTGDVAIFNRGSTITTLSAAVTAGSIKFDTATAGAYIIGTGAADSQTYIMAGSTTLQMTATVANNQTFNARLQTGGDRTAATYNLINESVAGKFIFNGSIGGFATTGTPATKVLTVSGAGNLDFNGVVTRSGATSLTLTKSGAGTLTFNNAGSKIGLLTLNGGVIDLAADLTVGDFSAATGAAGLNGSGGTITSSGGRILLGGGTTGGNGMDWSATAGGTITIEAVIADGGTYNNIDFYNTGTLVLKGANTYSGGSALFGTVVQIGVNSVGSVGAITSSALGTGTLTLGTSSGAAAGLYSDGATARTILNPVVFGNNATLGNATNNGVLTFSAGLNLGAAARTLTVNSAVQLDGSFSNSAATSGLTKAGPGTLTINAANTSFGTGNGFNITGGAVVAANTAAMGNAGQIVTLSSGSSFGTLDLATDTTANAYVLNFGSVAGAGGNVLVNRGTPGPGAAITHTMGTALLGNAKMNVLAGGNITSGTPTLELNGITLTAGAAGDGTATLNPTTARISVLSGGITRTGNTASTLTLGGTIDGNTIAGVIANRVSDGATLALTKSNTSTWELSAANTYSGGTVVTGGTLKLTHNQAIQNSAFDTSGAGTLDVTAINTPTFGGLTSATSYALPGNVTSLTLNPASGTRTYTGDLSGGAAGLTLTKTGAGAQVLGGTNSYSGDTTINAGSLQINTSGALGASANIRVNSGANGALVLGEPSAGAGLVAGSGKALTIQGGGVGSYFGALSNAVGTTGTTEWQGSVSIDENGSRIGAQGGTLKVSGNISATSDTHQLLVRNNGAFITHLTGTNDYVGGTRVVAGELHVSGGSALHDSGLVALDGTAGVVFKVLGSEAIGALASTAGTTPTASKVTIEAGQTLSLASGTQSYPGLIEGGGGLTVNGAVQTLTGANTYTGTTTVESGTLLINGSTYADGLITVSALGTLGGSGSGGDVTVDDDGTLAPGTATVNQFQVRNLLLGSASVFAVELDAPDPGFSASNDYLDVLEDLRLDGVLKVTPRAGFGTPMLDDKWLIMGVAGTITNHGMTVDPSLVAPPGLFYAIETDTSIPGSSKVYLTVVPEAGTAGLVAAGLLLIARRLRRRG